ncbi:replication initiator protein A [Staphylococcus aureus]
MRNTEKSFIKYRKSFLQNAESIKLSNDAKMAWGILRDRLDLSIKNGWII